MTDSPPSATEVTSTWAALPHELLDGGELVMLAIKPSMWRPALDSAPWLVTCLLLAIVLAGMRTPLPGFSIAVTVQVVLLVACVRLGVAILRWIPTWYILTNRRVVEVQGVRTPRVTSHFLTKIRNTYVTASPGERLCRLGTITFVTEDAPAIAQAWRSIGNPVEIHDKVRRAIEEARGI